MVDLSWYKGVGQSTWLTQPLSSLLECCPVSSSIFVPFPLVSSPERQISLPACWISFIPSCRIKLIWLTLPLSHQLLFFLPVRFFVFAENIWGSFLLALLYWNNNLTPSPLSLNRQHPASRSFSSITSLCPTQAHAPLGGSHSLCLPWRQCLPRCAQQCL